MLRWIRGLAPPLVAVTLFAIGSAALADTIQINYDAGASSPGTGSYVYNVIIDGNSKLKALGAANRAIFFDFPQLTSSSFVASSDLTTGGFGFTKTEESTTSATLYPGTTPTDTGATNVRLEFSKAGAGDLTGPHPLGVLTILSTLHATPQIVLDRVYSLDYNTSTDAVQRSLNATSVPVPLPATANMGLALIACLGFGAWRRMKAAKDVLA